MPREQVLCNVPRNCFLAFAQHSVIAIAHLGGNLIPYVQQLADIGVEFRAALVVSQRRGELGRGALTRWEGLSALGCRRFDLERGCLGSAPMDPIRLIA